jgi:hypothetical protein
MHVHAYSDRNAAHRGVRGCRAVMQPSQKHHGDVVIILQSRRLVTPHIYRELEKIICWGSVHVG